MCKDPKNVKFSQDVCVFFALLGSLLVKTLCKMLMKLTPAAKRYTKGRLERSINGHKIHPDIACVTITHGV